MTTTTTRDMTILARLWLTLDEAAHNLAIDKHTIEREMVQLMEADDAEEFTDGTVEVTRKRGIEWDQGVLDGLREFIPPDDLPSFMAAERVIAPKWNATKVKVLRKKGGDLKRIIDKAARPTLPVLTVKRVKP